MSLDPYAIAREHGDTTTLNKWERFSKRIQDDIILIFDYSPFLQYVRPTKRDEYGPIPDVWDESTRQVMALFQSSLVNSLATLPAPLPVELDSYFPPDAYLRGGPNVFPWELMQVVIDNSWLVGIGTGVASNAIYNAMTHAYRALREWFDEQQVPHEERTFPILSPFVIRSIVEGHALRYFNALEPGQPSVFVGGSVNANYPMSRVQFLVVLPYLKGTIIYFVNNALRLSTIIRTFPGGYRQLRKEGWPDGPGQP